MNAYSFIHSKYNHYNSKLLLSFLHNTQFVATFLLQIFVKGDFVACLLFKLVINKCLFLFLGCV